MSEEFRNGKIFVKADPDLGDLIPGFLEKRKSEAALIRGLVLDGNFKQIEVLGHQMKGAGAGYGFDGLSRIGLEIETAGRGELAEEVLEACLRLERYLENLEVVYHEGS